MWEAITAGLKALAEALGWGRDRNSSKNSADVKAAAIKAQEQEEVDAVNKAIAKKDEEAMRKILSEK